MKAENKTKNRHILHWIREQLELKQSDLARLIGSSQATIQSIELGRLKLSERFAYKLAARLGVDAKWLLANNWEDLPEPQELRESYAKASGTLNNTYEELIQLRYELLRSYLLQCVIVDELGWQGCNATGFFKIFERAQLDLLGTIGDKSIRNRVLQEFSNKYGVGTPLKQVDPLDVVDDALANVKYIKESMKESRSLLKERTQEIYRGLERAEEIFRGSAASGPPSIGITFAGGFNRFPIPTVGLPLASR